MQTMALRARWTRPAAALLLGAAAAAHGQTAGSPAATSPGATETQGATPAATAAPVIAGLQPDRRPEAAPRITTAHTDARGKERRLTGVLKPWPGNVEQMAEQGGWYSPFFHPGMPGRYDLRQWHARRP